jgi:hypothetical protein
MTVDTQGFREMHASIREQTAELRLIARRLPDLSDDERERARSTIVRYLREHVEPHTKLDEQLLYPEVMRRFGQPLIASSMNYDHLAIRDWMRELGQADIKDTGLLQQLLYGLDALIRVHLWKEDALFLGPIESHSWPRPYGVPGASLVSWRGLPSRLARR